MVNPLKYDKSYWYDKAPMNLEKCFFGTSTMGERGQVVIPAEARAELGFSPGDKLMIMRHPVHEGIVIFKLDAVRDFLSEMQTSFEKIASKSDEK